MGMLTRLWPTKPAVYCSGCRDNLETAERELVEAGLDYRSAAPGYRSAAPIVKLVEMKAVTPKLPRVQSKIERFIGSHPYSILSTLIVMGVFAGLQPKAFIHLFVGLCCVVSGLTGIWVSFPGMTRLGWFVGRRFGWFHHEYSYAICDGSPSYGLDPIIMPMWFMGVMTSLLIPISLWLGRMILP